MSSRQIPRAEWAPFLEHLDRTLSLPGKRAEIEVAGLPFGHPIAAEWLPLLGLDYAPRDDLIEIAVEGVDHLVRRPKELHVVDAPEGIVSVVVVDGDGNKHIVRFREALMLPAPAMQAHHTP